MKEALRSEGLAVSGVKISLQLRLIECEDYLFLSYRMAFLSER